MVPRSPRALASSYLGAFQFHLPGVRDGDAESVHQARIATRRLRELIPLIARTAREGDASRTLFRKAGRALGRVRELDVSTDVLAHVERLLPSAGAALAVVRERVAAEQQRARRRMVKRLEKLELDRHDAMLPATRRLGEMRERFITLGSWAVPLRGRMRQRADALHEAIDHAGGLYLPNRVHQVRIALKKLRYTTEIAQDIGMRRIDRLVRDLRRGQAVLGELHDRQVVLSLLPDPDGDERIRDGLAAIQALLRAEIADRHAQYLDRRDRLQMASRACVHLVTPHYSVWRRTGPLIVASAAIALPAAMSLRQQRAG